MNSVPNSDSEQCTESKLSRVHNAPTLGPACAHTRMHSAKAGRVALCRGAHWPRVVALPRPCRSLWPTVSWPCRRRVAARTRALARCVAAPLSHDTSLYCNPAPCCAPCRSPARPCRSAYMAVSWPVSRHN